MFRRGAIALLCCTSLLACAEPPTKERQQAAEALAAARASDAATYAPEDLAAAEAALVQYDEAVTQRDYRQALGFAIEARDRAHAASQTTERQKAAARAEADRLLASYTQLVAAATKRLAATGPTRLRPPVSDRVRAEVRRAPALLQESRTLVGKSEYRKAIALLEPAVKALQSDLAAAPSRSGRGRD